MIEFKVNEIPDGKSEQVLSIDPKEVNIGDTQLNGIQLKVRFDKSPEAIRLYFNVIANVTLICDRSLEPFEYIIDRNYDIVFKEGEAEEIEDEHSAIRSLNSHENKIRIDNEVRDTILLGIPIKKLHPKFLDENGNPTDFQKVYADKEYIDPRWEKLKSLKKD